MLHMTHPAGLEAVCVSVEQFDEVHAPAGWQLTVDDNGNPVEIDQPVPVAHVDHTPIHPAEQAETVTTTSGSDYDSDDDGWPVDLTRPEED